MAIAEFRNVQKEYQGRAVLDGASFELRAGQKVGLIGANGSGKTTLLRILCGQETPGYGEVSLAVDTKIGYVPQYIESAGERSVLDYVMQDFFVLRDRLTAAEHAVAQAGEQDHLAHIDTGQDPRIHRLLNEYEHAREAYEQFGGDQTPANARALLDSLGLTDRDDQPVRLLSGGEQNVVSMARALLNRPNLLVLDEPGNHLDYLGLAWLDDFLQRFRGAVLIVSHNRYLLDQVVSGIFELEKGKLRYYPGNYTASRKIREERIKAQEAQYKAHQQRIAHIEAMVRKFADIAQGHASDNSWGKRLRARRSQLERERSKAVEKPDADPQQIKLRLNAETTRADIAMQLRRYHKSYDDLNLFEGVNWEIGGGQRWALVGPNGCGKTTLLRDIIETGCWEDKVIRIGPSLTVGYCAQHQEELDGECTVFEELISIKGTTNEQVMGILARFLFQDEEIHKQIGNLSGGERNRLQLAKLMLEQPNFLILDEPTNHLDIPTREAVEQALKEFKGTILVVSHDRYFLDEIVDHVAEVRDRQLHFYHGNFTRYWESVSQQLESVTGRVTTRGKVRRTDEDKPKLGAQARQQRKAAEAAVRKAQNYLTKLERQVAEAESHKQQLEQRIAQAFTTGDNETGSRLSRELEQHASMLERLYEEWLIAGEKVTDCENTMPE